MGAFDDDEIYVANPGDKPGDDLSRQPEATRELRKASVAALMRAIQHNNSVVVKITKRGDEKRMVRGYVTMARFLQGATPRQFEQMLGMRIGSLAGGCFIYYLAKHAITADNIAPRAFTDWPGGVSPRELENRSKAAGRQLRYHPDYPPARDPIPQFVIHRPVPARLAHVLAANERFDQI